VLLQVGVDADFGQDLLAFYLGGILGPVPGVAEDFENDVRRVIEVASNLEGIALVWWGASHAFNFSSRIILVSPLQLPAFGAIHFKPIVLLIAA